MKRIKMRHTMPAALIAAAGLTLASGCQHYRVEDPASGETYYTTRIRHRDAPDVITFKDARTGEEVTVRSNQIREISPEEFKRSVQNDGS